jgi:hypothetical protein
VSGVVDKIRSKNDDGNGSDYITYDCNNTVNSNNNAIIITQQSDYFLPSIEDVSSLHRQARPDQPHRHQALALQV